MPTQACKSEHKADVTVLSQFKRSVYASSNLVLQRMYPLTHTTYT